VVILPFKTQGRAAPVQIVLRLSKLDGGMLGPRCARTSTMDCRREIKMLYPTWHAKHCRYETFLCRSRTLSASVYVFTLLPGRKMPWLTCRHREFSMRSCIFCGEKPMCSSAMRLVCRQPASSPGDIAYNKRPASDVSFPGFPVRSACIENLVWYKEPLR
jgi:hypothetical protein